MRAYGSRFTRRWAVLGLAGGLAWLTWHGFALLAQDQPPARKDVTISAKDFRFSPARVEVAVNDLVRVTVQSEDIAYGFTVDAYRISKRVPAGGSVVFEFRADRAGAFPFYSGLTSDARHAQAKGEFVVAAR